MLFYVLSNPYVVPKLQKELDSNVPNPGVPEFQQVKDLP
jgi:hypothetical protein